MFPLTNARTFVPPPPGGPFAGGVLSQSGNTISGILHVTGSPCFDPVADALPVQGTVSSHASALNALMLTTSPVRGQTLRVSATWDNSLFPGGGIQTSPPNSVSRLVGTWAIVGGPCASTDTAPFYISDFNGTFTNVAGWSMVLSQTGPDAQGFFQTSGTFKFPGSSCFSSGTLSNTTFAGDIAQMTVVTDTGQLIGSAQTILQLDGGATFPVVVLRFTIHGGSCDGKTQSATICASGHC